MKKIYLITDYKNFFGSKWNSSPYRSGYDKDYLTKLFADQGYDLVITPAASIDVSSDLWKNAFVLYTSSEEPGLHYKSYLENLVSALELKGATVIPKAMFLRAHENKVFMEQLRKVLLPAELQTIQARTFGALEELKQALKEKSITLPTVIKTASGAMSKGVYLAKTEKELLKLAKKISSTLDIKRNLKEKARIKKHKGYLPESQHQGKFILQPFIPNLTCDWKLLIYGNKIFILQRNIKDNDFRASGSGYNYKAGGVSGFPLEFLDFAYDFFQRLQLPNLSLDFAFDGKNPYIIEFQALYFGTSTQYKSKDYYELIDGKWELKENTFDQETIYVDSVVNFLQQKC